MWLCSPENVLYMITEPWQNPRGTIAIVFPHYWLLFQRYLTKCRNVQGSPTMEWLTLNVHHPPMTVPYCLQFGFVFQKKNWIVNDLLNSSAFPLKNERNFDARYTHTKLTLNSVWVDHTIAYNYYILLIYQFIMIIQSAETQQRVYELYF